MPRLGVGKGDWCSSTLRKALLGAVLDLSSVVQRHSARWWGGGRGDGVSERGDGVDEQEGLEE